MKRLFAILSLIIVLIAICTFEEVFLDKFIPQFTSEANSLSTLIKGTENLNNEEINTNYKKLNNNWNNAKIIMCFFTNYEKIKSLDESFIKLNSAIKNNDKNLANENISIICNYEKFLNYMMGFNFNNLF